MTRLRQSRSRRSSANATRHHVLLLILPFLLLLIEPSISTWEQSNDPDRLCSSPSTGQKLTGYASTPDCRGYVYCADGYLMGGVISCWPNQLFDGRICTRWQDVDTSNCPELDDAMMMPELKDGNANEKRFFCGVSASNAKRVCEPCPGGSRLECTDVTHNCFAGITGCPTGGGAAQSSSSSNNGNPLGAASSSSSNGNPPPPPPATRRPTLRPVNPPPPTPPPTRRVTSRPTRFPTRRPVAAVDNNDENFGDADSSSSNNNNNNVEASAVTVNDNPSAPSPSNNNDDNDDNNHPTNSDMTNDVYLHGKLRSSYYCGYSWELAGRACA
eukprot:CAMPEP_0181113836 /NCGR_PEP_ID=MMETSP1071-20121207/20559_1 /TAXON_ID=35127 /ORGANISM="Thalassiosira sp., Strain NH16" /LENGTH=327 /DNA_ID=CAMNT_0023197899 /DNA_START=361 /DNA_END=1341 /DNA_ORIENTATION=-